MELLQDEVAALNHVLDEQKLISSSGRKERTDSFESFKKELTVKKEQVEDKKEKLTSVNDILDVMFKEMENLFSLFKCNSPSLIHLLGKSLISNRPLSRRFFHVPTPYQYTSCNINSTKYLRSKCEILIVLFMYLPTNRNGKYFFGFVIRRWLTFLYSFHC